MSVCICGESAEKILDLLALGRMKSVGHAGGSQLASCRAGKKDLAEALGKLSMIEQFPGLEEPVRLLVTHPKLRTSSDLVHASLWSGSVPEGSLLILAPGVYVASPEFNALLEMRGQTRVERALTLMRACGIFAMDESSEDGFVRRPQLTDVARLCAFARGLKRMHCTEVLLNATNLVVERARSPLEAKLALAITMDYRVGGLGLPRPSLNATVRLGGNAQAIAGKSAVDADMLWDEARAVIEANGKLRHEGRFGEDLTRASALEAEGYAVRFVTSMQLRSPRQMLILGSWLAGRLGIDPKTPSRERLQCLLGTLMAFEYPRYSLSKRSEG